MHSINSNCFNLKVCNLLTILEYFGEERSFERNLNRYTYFVELVITTKFFKDY